MPKIPTPEVIIPEEVQEKLDQLNGIIPGTGKLFAELIRLAYISGWNDRSQVEEDRIMNGLAKAEISIVSAEDVAEILEEQEHRIERDCDGGGDGA